MNLNAALAKLETFKMKHVLETLKSIHQAHINLAKMEASKWKAGDDMAKAQAKYHRDMAVEFKAAIRKLKMK